MPYQYLNNEPRMDAIQQIGQAGGGLATALPQLQIQAQAFRQRMALQRAQELLNDQRMNESKARAKLYEGEQKLNESKGQHEDAMTGEVKARTEHTQGQEERERNIAQAAMMMGQAMANRYLAQSAGTNAPNPEQDATSQAIQAASLLSARDPNMMARFASGMQGTPHNVPPGNVAINQQGQPMYTNQQPTGASMRVLAPGQELYQGNQPVATNTNVRATAGGGGGLGPAAQAILSRMQGGPRSAAAAPNNAPTPGTVYKGYRFKGGNPAEQASWEKVQ